MSTWYVVTLGVCYLVSTFEVARFCRFLVAAVCERSVSSSATWEVVTFCHLLCYLVHPTLHVSIGFLTPQFVSDMSFYERPADVTSTRRFRATLPQQASGPLFFVLQCLQYFVLSPGGLR